MAEIIEKTGKSYNIFDKINNVWNKISFWHKASDCEFDDGKTAQTKLGAINGITSDLTGEAEDIAASIKCVNQLNSSLENLVPKYNPEDDWIYIGNEKWKRAYLHSLVILQGGELNIPFEQRTDWGYFGWTTGNVGYKFENGKIKVYDKTSGNAQIGGGCATAQMIDFTNYTKLKVKIDNLINVSSGSSALRIGVAGDISATNYFNQRLLAQTIFETAITTTTTYEVDLSNISTTGYIVIFMYKNSSLIPSITISEMVLE